MKTVLVCANVYPPNITGGAELIAHYQSKALQAKGYRMFVFAGNHAQGVSRYSLATDTYEGMPVFRIGLEPCDYASEYVNFSHSPVEERFHRILDEISPDVLHAHNLIGLSVGLLRAAKNRGLRTVLTVHDHWGFCFKNTLIKSGHEICRDYSRCAECMAFIDDGAQRRIPIRMRRDFLKFQLEAADALISPSLYLAEAYARAGVPIEKIHQIWYGIDVERFSKIRKTPRTGSIRFTFIGRFGKHKGVHVVLEALQLLRSPQVHLNLAGAGELEHLIQEQVRSSGLSSAVRFWRQVDHRRIESLLSETDVLILPSIWPENQPVTITEAMASRTPVIASDIGGIPELLRNGVTGFLIPPGDAVGLAEKMNLFVAHPELIETLGENGFERMKENTYERQVDKIAFLYR